MTRKSKQDTSKSLVEYAKELGARERNEMPRSIKDIAPANEPAFPEAEAIAKEAVQGREMLLHDVVWRNGNNGEYAIILVTDPQGKDWSLPLGGAAVCKQLHNWETAGKERCTVVLGEEVSKATGRLYDVLN